MNAKKMKEQKNMETKLSLVSIETAYKPSLSERIKSSFRAEGMTLEQWERLESKRSPQSFRSTHQGRF